MRPELDTGRDRAAGLIEIVIDGIIRLLVVPPARSRSRNAGLFDEPIIDLVADRFTVDRMRQRTAKIDVVEWGPDVVHQEDAPPAVGRARLALDALAGLQPTEFARRRRPNDV